MLAEFEPLTIATNYIRKGSEADVLETSGAPLRCRPPYPHQVHTVFKTGPRAVRVKDAYFFMLIFYYIVSLKSTKSGQKSKMFTISYFKSRLFAIFVHRIAPSSTFSRYNS
nr:MAG TPA: hypothetical protein [Caudoviricetes sp.]